MSARMAAFCRKEIFVVGLQHPLLIELPTILDSPFLGNDSIQKRKGDRLRGAAGYFNLMHFMSSMGWVKRFKVGQAGAGVIFRPAVCA